MSTPGWLRILLCLLSPAYYRGWVRLEERSRVTGIARERKVIWRVFGYNWVVEREIRPNSDYKKDQP